MFTAAFILLILSFIGNASSFELKNSIKSIRHGLKMVNIGDVAPDFELKNSQGKSFKLSSFKGKKPVVVFFYPADNTPGCTTEVLFIP